MTAVTTNANRVTKVRDIISTLIDSHFTAMLGREQDIVNIVNALVCRESTFNVNAMGVIVSSSQGTSGAAYLKSSAVSSLLSSSTITPTQKANIERGLRAVGLMQVMGYNFVRGGAPSGKSELERVRPDLAGPLMVAPGEDPTTKILGEDNIEKAITAGLIMLESKYRAVNVGTESFFFPSDRYRRQFSSRIQAAVAAYLGLGQSDANGTTPQAYANQILGGSFYVAANGKGSLKIRDSEIQVASSNGPATNGSGLTVLTQSGCG